MKSERGSAKGTAVDLVIDSVDLGQNQISTEWKDGFFSRGVVRLRNLEQAPSGDLEARPQLAFSGISGLEQVDADDVIALYSFRRSGGERREILATKYKLYWIERVGGFKSVAHEIKRAPSTYDLGGITVTAERAGGGYTAMTTTDAYGGYYFPDCPTGTYTLTFTRSPDINYTKEVTVS